MGATAQMRPCVPSAWSGRVLCKPPAPLIMTVLARGMTSPAFSWVVEDRVRIAGRATPLGQVMALSETAIGSSAPRPSSAYAGRVVPAFRMVPRSITEPSGRRMAEVATQSCGRTAVWVRRTSASIT
ncbi:hypothetical protein D3C85_364740 [compost metagenome]